MGDKLIIFSNNINQEWHLALQAAWQPYGNLAVLKEEDAKQHRQIEASLIIIDASTIRSGLGDFVEQLRGTFARLPIVVITTSPTWRRARLVFRAGATDFVRRTNNIDKLRDLFARLLPPRLTKV